MAVAAGPPRQPGTICFVTTEFAGIGRDNQIGVHFRLMSGLLARRGWEVHVLFCGGVDDGDERCEALAEPARWVAAFHVLEDFPAPLGAGIPHFGGDHPTVILGEHALEALEELHAEHQFDLIEFPDLSALGLRAVQSKVAGDALLDASLAVKLHGPGQWRRKCDLEQRSAPRELKLEFCERYAFERADVQLSASRCMLDYARGIDWTIRDDAAVACPYPDPDPNPAEQDEVATACDPKLWNDRIDATYRGFLGLPQEPRVARASDTAKVTVAVSHFNHDRFLPGALASLAVQTRQPDEVIVVDDGSTSETALRVFAQQEARYPDWTFVRQENAGPGIARNRCLERATGAYFLPFDSDNIATPRLIERLLEAMERNPSRAVTTCHNLGFVDDADVEAGDFAFRYSPTGGPRLSACVENVYGDTCALFRAESLRSVGGFETHPWSPDEDWETFVKMTVRGLEVEVLPQPLFYYRTDSGGRLQTLTADPAVNFRQRAHLIDEFFADAELTPRERRDLWECLLAFDRFATEGLNQRLSEQRLWHDSQMADLHAGRLAQLRQLRAELGGEVEAERSRADAAEGELAALVAITPRRLVRRALRTARARISSSSRSES